MNEKKASQTAVGNAFIRGYHATNDVPRIFDDFLAYQFLTEEERLFSETQIAAVAKFLDPAHAASLPDQAATVAWMMQKWVASSLVISRARYVEDRSIDAIGQGVKQYVILGAGIDTFAFRHKELLEWLKVFEIDHPDTQDFKRRRIGEMGWDIPANLHFVPLDFTRDKLAPGLKSAYFDPQALSFFSWQGVTYYLTRDAVFATLQAIADIAPVGSMIVFDYLDTNAFLPEKVAPRVQNMLKGLQQAGEPMKAAFDPLTLASDMAGLGLRLQENLSPSDIEERYFRGRNDDYHAYEHFHYACAVVE